MRSTSAVLRLAVVGALAATSVVVPAAGGAGATSPRPAEAVGDVGAPAAASGDASASAAVVDPCTGLDSPDTPDEVFTDVACDAAFFHEIWWLARAGLARGSDDGRFGPRRGVTRREAAALLWAAAGSPEGPFPDPGFSDVDHDGPFGTEVAWLVDAGLGQGLGDGTFGASAPVTRRELAVLLWAQAGSPEGPFPDPGFADVDHDGPFGAEVAWLVDAGITLGLGDGTFGASAPVTRQAMAAFSYRAELADRIDPESAGRCETLDPTECLLPYPSDHLTVDDAVVDREVGSSGTGLRLALDPASMPTNTEGVAIDPAPLNHNDGFSPGQAVVLRVPGIDLDRTGAPPITDLAAALDADAPMVIVDADTGERVPLFAELDVTADDPQRQALFLRPTRNLVPGHRHVVALRRLRDAAGDAIVADEAFAALRDGVPTGIAAVEGRRADLSDVWPVLADAGIDRHDLYLAWDFTVASDQNLSERILAMRDEAFAALGGDAPGFVVDEVLTDVNDSIATEVRGRLTVPNYLTGDGGPGQTMTYGPDGLPHLNGTMEVPITCIVPYAASAEAPARISLFGHGLLGTGRQVLGFSTVAQAHNTVFCGTDWLGMSTPDLPVVAEILGDLSGFHAIPDRAQQGFLAFLFLGRLMQHPEGLSALPSFQDGGESLLDTGELLYVGGSQGGIMGGSLAAVAQDFTKAVLAVPGMNYSTMLQRSSNWPVFDSVMSAAYPDPLDKALALVIGQGLWDRGEANGYAHRLVSNPLPGTPAKQVLLFEAFGDHQVANVATETMARTMGVPVRRPALAPGRTPVLDPFWGLDPVPAYPYEGSALVVWDWGTPAPPITNTHPTEGDDPHGNVGDAEETVAQAMLLHFLTEGEVIDVCDAQPCPAAPSP